VHFIFQLRNIKLKGVEGDDHDDEEMVGEEWESLFGRTSNKEAASARVFRYIGLYCCYIRSMAKLISLPRPMKRQGVLMGLFLRVMFL